MKVKKSQYKYDMESKTLFNSTLWMYDGPEVYSFFFFWLLFFWKKVIYIYKRSNYFLEEKLFWTYETRQRYKKSQDIFGEPFSVREKIFILTIYLVKASTRGTLSTCTFYVLYSSFIKKFVTENHIGKLQMAKSYKKHAKETYQGF